MRGEYDFNDNLTAYAAYGFRRSKENNSLANLTVSNINGNGSIYRFDTRVKTKLIRAKSVCAANSTPAR